MRLQRIALKCLRIVSEAQRLAAGGHYVAASIKFSHEGDWNAAFACHQAAYDRQARMIREINS
jgi:hypothetical protein